MIDITKLTESDIGRRVIYKRPHCYTEQGWLTSWNPTFIFVRFRNPNGEACCPEDVTFEHEIWNAGASLWNNEEQS